MSTDYYIYGSIPISELFGGQLDKYGIRDAQAPESTDDARCLTDGENNYLWAYANPVTGFTRWMPNGWPGFILQAVANEFGFEISSEYDEETPSYVPLSTPTDDEIAIMRAEARAESVAFDQRMESVPVG